ISCLLLIFLSPAVSGAPSAMFPRADCYIFPLTSPGLISIPIGFLCSYIGTLISKPDNLEALAAEMEVRSLTGVGVEAAVDHYMPRANAQNSLYPKELTAQAPEGN